MNSELSEFEKLIENLLNQRFQTILKKTLDLKIESIEFDEIEKEINFISSGRLLYCFAFTDSPASVALIPDDFLNEFQEIYLKSTEKEMHKNLNSEMAQSLFSPINKLMYFSGDSHQMERIEKNKLLIESFHNATFVSNFDISLKEEFMWRASESTSYRLRAGNTSLFLLIRDVNKYYLEKDISEKKGYADQLQKICFNVLPKENVHLTRLDVKSPNELLLNRFFLHNRTKCQDVEIYSRFRNFRTPMKADLTNDRIRFGLELTIEGKQLPIYYSIFLKDKSNSELRKSINSHIACIFKDLLSSWTKMGIEIEKKAAGPIQTMNLGGSICITVELIEGKNIIPCEIFLAKSTLEFLKTHLLDEDDIESAYLEHSGDLVRFLYLNRSILRRNISTFYKEGTADFLEAGSPILFYQFVNLLTDKDLKLLVQNYFVSRGWKVDEIKSLFYCYVPSENEKDKTLIFFPDFHDEKFVKFLPESMAEEWRNSSVRPEWSIHLIPKAISKEEFIKKNNEVMKNIFEMSKKKIDLSSKGKLVLQKEFASVLDSKLTARIDEVNSENLSILEKIPLIPKQSLQKYFYEWNHLDLALAMYGWEGKMDLIKPHISKNFLQSVLDDKKAIESKIEDMSLDLEKVIELKQNLIHYIVGMTEEEVV